MADSRGTRADRDTEFLKHGDTFLSRFSKWLKAITLQVACRANNIHLYLPEEIVLANSIHSHLGVTEHGAGFRRMHVLFGQVVLGAFLGFCDGLAFLLDIASIVFELVLAHGGENYNLFFHTLIVDNRPVDCQQLFYCPSKKRLAKAAAGTCHPDMLAIFIDCATS